MGSQGVTPDKPDAPDTQRPPPIDYAAMERFLRTLRTDLGFQIGPREHMAAIALVAELVAERYVADPRDLHDYLAPLLMRSRTDATRFRRAFDEAFPRPLPPGRDVAPGAQTIQPAALPDTRKWYIKWWPAFAAIAGTLLIAAFLSTVKPERSSLFQDVPSSPAFQGAAATPEQLPTDRQYDVFGVAEGETPEGWLALAIVAGLLALTTFWLARANPVRRAHIRRRLPHDGARLHQLASEQEHLLRRRTEGMRRAAQRLGVWTLRETDQLDVARTVEGSILQGRFFPVRASVFARPDYLVLIEARGAADHAAQRMRDLVRQLQQEQVHADVYYYERSPDFIYREDDRFGAAAPFSGPATSLASLAFHYPNHRLLILGSGAHFLQPTRPLVLSGLELLQRWERRALLTPVALAEWGSRELVIANQLQLPIGRATESGFVELAGILGLASGRDEGLLAYAGDAHANELPAILRANPLRWTLDAPSNWVELRTQLIRYLDEDAYAWLCACAVYPEVRWDLTLFLGLSLQDTQGRSVYREDRLAELTRLPWFREGRIPDWIRDELIHDLGAHASDVQEVLQKLVQAARGSADQDERTVSLTLASEGRGRTDDQLFVDFLSRPRATDFEVRAAAGLRDLLPRTLARWADIRSIASVVVGVAGAAAGWIVSPRNAIDLSQLPFSAWLPLDAALLATLGALVLINPSPLRLSFRALASAAVATATFIAALIFGVALDRLCGETCDAIAEEAGLSWLSTAAAAILLLAAAGSIATGRIVTRSLRGPARRSGGIPEATALASLAVLVALQVGAPSVLAGQHSPAILATVIGLGLLSWVAVDLVSRATVQFGGAILVLIDGVLDVVGLILGGAESVAGSEASVGASLIKQRELSERLKGLAADSEGAAKASADFWTTETLDSAAAREASAFLEGGAQYIPCDKNFCTKGFRELVEMSERPVQTWLRQARRFAEDCRAEIARWDQAAKDSGLADSLDRQASGLAVQFAAAQDALDRLLHQTGQRYEPTSIALKLPFLIIIQLALGSMMYFLIANWLALTTRETNNVFIGMYVVLLMLCAREFVTGLKQQAVSLHLTGERVRRRPLLAVIILIPVFILVHQPGFGRTGASAISVMLVNVLLLSFSALIFYGEAEDVAGTDLAKFKRDLLRMRVRIVASRVAGLSGAGADDTLGTARLRSELQNLGYYSLKVQRQREETLRYAFRRYATFLAEQERRLKPGGLVLQAPDGRTMTAGELRSYDFTPT